MKALEIFCTLSRYKLWSIPRSIRSTVLKSELKTVSDDDSDVGDDMIFEQVSDSN